MQKVKPYISTILIGILVLIILLQRSCGGTTIADDIPTVTVKTDTIWKTKHDTVTNTVKVIKIIHGAVPADPQFHPSDDIDTCKVRFNKLLTEYLTTRVYADTLKLDSLGTIIINDTVFMNKLGKRVKIYDYKIPLVTKTVTITKPAELKRQVYIGGNLFGDRTKLQLLTPGILYKTRKDHIYQANIGINFDGTLTYGLGAYWKIKLK